MKNDNKNYLKKTLTKVKSKNNIKKYKIPSKKKQKSNKKKNQIKKVNDFIIFENLEILTEPINRFIIEPSYLRNKYYLKLIDTKYNKLYLLEIIDGYTYCIYDNKINMLFFLNDKGHILIHIENYIKILKQIKSDEYNISKVLINTMRNKALSNNKIKLIILSNINGCYNVNLDKINEKLTELNTKLQDKCPELSLKLDKYYNLTGNLSVYNKQYNKNNTNLVLCLYYNYNCVSSIILNYKDNGIIEIDSLTSKKMEGKKYNKLLRSILILVSSSLVCGQTNINTIHSSAINPISAWLLIGYYECTYTSDPPYLFDKFINENKQMNKKELIFGAYKENINLNIKVSITKNNIEKANIIFNSLIKNDTKSIKCVDYHNYNNNNRPYVGIFYENLFKRLFS